MSNRPCRRYCGGFAYYAVLGLVQLSIRSHSNTLVVFAGQGSTGVRACNADSVEESGAAGTLSTI